METASPPVSPSVVARIFMIQKVSVTCGTLPGARSRKSVVIVSGMSRVASVPCKFKLAVFACKPAASHRIFINSRKGLHMTPNQHTVETYMDGFRHTDRARILSCLTDDVEWLIPGMFH